MENKIKVMSENLANKIAAGEVVEKCSSIVKELVENSIDAKSTKIIIELIDSGIKEIKIIDNGTGMTHDDALLSFQRHATSKLLDEADLFFINSLGFRGEALPSIASVSEVLMTTCANETGIKIHIKGGQLLEDSKTQSKKGTTLIVKNLFYNTPARLKYLKSEQTELANSVAFVEHIALSYPNIAFTLSNNGNVVINTTGSNNLHKVIHEIYGIKVSSNMLEVTGENDDYSVYGYVCKPEILKSNRNHFITIVNNRVVRNNELNQSINDAYYTYKPDNKYPIVVLKIETDPTLIDVNIHPTKQDIKLSKIEELKELMTRVIKDALYKTVLIPKVELSPLSNNVKQEYIEEKTASSEINEEQVVFNLGVKESTSELITNPELKSLVLYPVGLVHGTYIICENEDGMYIVDQHAAQERVNYEKYLKNLKDKKVDIIQTLFPINIELSTSEFLTIKENIDVLTNIGFKIEEFGINSYTIKEHPTWLKVGFEEESIRKIFDLVISYKKDFNDIKFQEHVAITLSCKMSVKGNTRISHEAMEEIITSLVQTDNPYNCPHGRPTIISFTSYELEKMFKRVM